MADQKTAAPVVGITLGTGYCCVGVWKNNAVDIIANDQGNRTMPTYVAYTDTEKLVGESAFSQAAANPENTVFDITRLLGTRFNESQVQTSLKRWPFKVIQDPKTEQPIVQVKFKGENIQVKGEELVALVLARAKRTAEEWVGQAVSEAIVAVPAYFGDSQRHAMVEAARLAGLRVLRLINEPAAALIAYGFDKPESGTPEGDVLILNLGATSVTAAVVHVTDGLFQTKALANDLRIGGDDFDGRIAQHFADEFKRKTKKDITTNTRAQRRLRGACERAKRTLSQAPQAAIELDSLFDGEDLFSNISRAKFDGLCQDLFRDCLAIVDHILEEAQVGKKDIRAVVMVGGTARIPRLQQMVRDMFDQQPLKTINPDEALAYGAAIEGSVISRTAAADPSKLMLLDVTALTVGLATSGGGFLPIIPKNTAVPCERRLRFQTNIAGQDSVLVQLYEGERAKAADNRMLAGVALKLPKSAEHAVVEVICSVDYIGTLNVRVRDEVSGADATLVVSPDQKRATHEEAKNAIDSAEGLAGEDEAFRACMRSRATLRAYVGEIYTSLRSAKFAALNAKASQELSEAAGAARDWLQLHPNADRTEIEDRMEQLKDAAKAAEISMTPAVSDGPDDLDATNETEQHGEEVEPTESEEPIVHDLD